MIAPPQSNSITPIAGPVIEGKGTPMPANMPAEARMVLDTVKGYAREESHELLTHPEWDLVYGSEAYAKWLEDGKRPSQFPFIGSVGTFWESYAMTSAATCPSVIAAVIDVPLGTVMSRLARARERLHRDLTRRGSHGG